MIHGLLLVCVCVQAPTTAPTTAPASRPAVVRIGLLPPGKGNPRNSEGDFIRLRDGRILLVYTRFTGGGSDHAAAHLAGRVSRDGGLTWSKNDTLVVANEGKMNVMSVSLLRLADGRIALFYLRKNSTRDCRPRLRISGDEAATWGPPSDVIGERDMGYYVLNNDRVVQLRGGRLVVPVARHAADGFAWNAAAEVLCWLSDDAGRTWRPSKGLLNPRGRKDRVLLQEPGVVELRDGRVMMFLRTNRGSQYVCHSRDAGETFSRPRPSNLRSPVSPASIERIPSTGHLLCVWNDHRDVDAAHKGKRTPLRIAVSRDEGTTWTLVRTLEDDPGGWYCYTAIAFVGPRVLLAHCAGQRRTGGLNRTQITAVDLAWLYGKR